MNDSKWVTTPSVRGRPTENVDAGEAIPVAVTNNDGSPQEQAYCRIEVTE
ncbi:hypothetical protein GCM10010297_17710 [Streptomyces malachitofuscus]|nr:hypothetical protein GCM10010297_17710 [Streptomyces malachitofuscus]